MSIVDDFITAFNRNDVDALLACFTGDAVYVDNFYGEHAGTARLRVTVRYPVSDDDLGRFASEVSRPLNVGSDPGRAPGSDSKRAFARLS